MDLDSLLNSPSDLLCSFPLLSKENPEENNSVDNKDWNDYDENRDEVNAQDRAAEEEMLEFINKIAY